MKNQNQMYCTWNQESIKETVNQQHHTQQILQSAECLQKFNDLMDAMDKVTPTYKEMLFWQMYAAYMAHNAKNQQKGDPYVHQYSR